MKKLLIVLCIIFGLWLVCYVYVNYEPLGDLGPEGQNTKVTYYIPSESGGVTATFYISGDVQLVRFTPTSNYPDENGFVLLKIKTSGGWHVSPVASVGEPIDSNKPLEVTFEYPKHRQVRKRTRAFMCDNVRLLGIFKIQSTKLGGFLMDGDIAKVVLHYQNGNMKCSVYQTTGLKSYGSAGASGNIEVIIQE